MGVVASCGFLTLILGISLLHGNMETTIEATTMAPCCTPGVAQHVHSPNLLSKLLKPGIEGATLLYDLWKEANPSPRRVPLYLPDDAVSTLYWKKRNGRLGNVMFQAAALYAISKTRNLRGVIVHDEDLKHFPNLPFQVVDGYNYSKQSTSLMKTNIGFIPAYVKPTHLATDAVLECYCQSFKYFLGMEQEIRQIFQFSESLQRYTKRCMLGILSKLKKPMPDKIVFVGVHVRRGDLTKHINYAFGNRLPEVSYFIKAMDNFKNTLSDSRVLFLVGSDDIQWCRKHLYHYEDVTILDGDPTSDLAVLSSCDHVIMSVGTFGWWAGFLSRGEVIYFKNHIAPASQLSKIRKARDHYLPHWIGMGN